MWRRWVLGWAGALLLAGCLFNDESARLSIVRSSAAEASVVFFAGKAAAEEVALFVGGDGLSVQDARCRPQGRGQGCELDTVAADSSYTLQVRGSRLSANVTFYRPGSSVPKFIATGE